MATDRQKEYYQKNKEKIKKQAHEWAKNNHDRFRELNNKSRKKLRVMPDESKLDEIINEWLNDTNDQKEST
jgi:hypothetical protein